MIAIGPYAGKVPIEYMILFQFIISIVIIFSAIYLIIMLYKEKSKLWILGAIVLLFIFFSILFPEGLIKAILNFILSILMLVYVIKLTKWYKNKKLMENKQQAENEK
jgi:predicted membrane protein